MLNIFFNDSGIQDWIDSCQKLQMWWWEIILSNECVNMDGGLVVDWVFLESCNSRESHCAAIQGRILSKKEKEKKERD